MEKIVKVCFVTSDKQEHSTKEAAKEHEAKLSALKSLADILNSSICTGRIDAVLRHLLLENERVGAVLRLYKKRLPRRKLESV